MYQNVQSLFKISGVKSMLCRVTGAIKRVDNEKISLKVKRNLLEKNNNWFDSLKEIYLFFLYLENKFEREFLLQDDTSDDHLYYEVDPVDNFRVFRVCQRLLTQTIVDTRAVLVSWARLMLDNEFGSDHEDILLLKKQLDHYKGVNFGQSSYGNHESLDHNNNKEHDVLEKVILSEDSFISVAENRYFNHFDQTKCIRFKV